VARTIWSDKGGRFGPFLPTDEYPNILWRLCCELMELEGRKQTDDTVRDGANGFCKAVRRRQFCLSYDLQVMSLSGYSSHCSGCQVATCASAERPSLFSPTLGPPKLGRSVGWSAAADEHERRPGPLLDLEA
jgi:hypothetical protein